MAQLNDIEIDQYLFDCVNVAGDIDGEFHRLPADLAYWNEKFAQAMRAFLMAGINRKRVAARLHLELRETLALAKGKAPTVNDLDAAVEGHVEYQEVVEEEVAAEVDKVRLYGIVDALRAKRDVILQIGRTQLLEMQNDPVLRDQHMASKIAKGS